MGFIDADDTIDNGDTGLKNDGQDCCVHPVARAHQIVGEEQIARSWI